MAKVKQPFDGPHFVPDVGRNVGAGEVVEIPEHLLPNFLEAGWPPADDKTRKAGKQLLDDGVITVLAGVKSAPATNGQEA